MSTKVTLSNKRFLIYDVECYAEDYCFVWYDIATDRVLTYDSRKPDLTSDLAEAVSKLSHTVLVGWNNAAYDDLLFATLIDSLLLKGALPTPGTMKQLNDDIIVRKTVSKYNYDIYKGNKNKWAFSVDLMNIKKPFVTGDALKEVAAKLGFPSVEETPISFDSVGLTDTEWKSVVDYCINDVLSTAFVYSHPKMRELLEVREALALEYTSLSGEAYTLGDASIAEKVLMERYVSDVSELWKETSRIKKAKPSTFVFDPSTHIHPNIRFIGEDNQAVLERFKSLQPFVVGDKDGLKSKDIALRFANFKFSLQGQDVVLGQGGLHTTVRPQFVTGNIYDIDVNSYYPTLMIQMNLVPAGMSDRFTFELNALTRERLEYKSRANTIKANALKLVINSLFGKTGSKFSPLYDPVKLLQTTVNGQLILMMLIEMLDMYGLKIIAGNTDGVMVQGESGFESIVREIESLFDLKFSTERYSNAIIRDVNNYTAEYVKGLLKRKGAFGGTEYPVVYRAIESHFLKGIHSVDTITKSRNIMDFAVVTKTTAPAHKRKLVSPTGEIQPAQKVHRYYKSLNGLTLIQGSTSTKSIALIDKLPDTFPSDIDFDFYITKALEQISDITNSVLANEEHFDKAANDARALGLVVVPKGGYNRKTHEYFKKSGELSLAQYNYWKTNQLTASRAEGFVGFGFFTGNCTNILSIDIDNLEQAHASGLFDVLPKNKGLVTAHGDYVRDDVLRGRHRGTISFLYEYKENPVFETTKLGRIRTSAQLGFETFYDKPDNSPATIIQCYGPYSTADGDRYSFSGKLEALPKKLQEWLELKESVIPEAAPTVVVDFNDYDTVIDDAEILEDLVFAIEESKKVYDWPYSSDNKQLFDFDTWRRFSFNVFSIVGADNGIAIMREFWPERAGDSATYDTLAKSFSPRKDPYSALNSLQQSLGLIKKVNFKIGDVVSKRSSVRSFLLK